MISRQQLSALAHAHHPIAAPLADATVERLLARAVGPGTRRLLDLGCGTGEWLVRAARLQGDVTGVGVDVDGGVITRGRELVRAAGLADRIELREGDAREVSLEQAADCVLSIGAAHAFGGLLPTLAAVRPHLADAGTVVIGEGYWESDPTEEVLAIGFERDEFADLATTVDGVVEAGWAPIYGHVSTAAEWDDYEWAWSGSLTQWGLDQGDKADAEAALSAAGEHRSQWLRGYRGVLGFVTPVLRSTSSG
jgi:SAM-dependent methyltransferase